MDVRAVFYGGSVRGSASPDPYRQLQHTAHLHFLSTHMQGSFLQRKLRQHDASYVVQRIEFTGKAKQWQMNSVNIECFGSLLNNLEFDSENELLTESREDADRKIPKEIRAGFRKGR